MNMGNVKLKSAAIFLLLLAFLLSARAASAATIGVPTNYLSMNTGLVGYWTFDGKDTVWTSATAATTLDKSGNGNTGTLTNMSRSSSPVSGKIGQGLKFDGGDDYVHIPLPTIVAPYTVSLWYKPNKLGANQTVISLQGEGTYPKFVFASNNKLLMYISATKFLYSTKVYNSSDLNKWNHAVFVIPSSVVSGWNLYINGATSNGVSNDSGAYNDPSTYGSIGIEEVILGSPGSGTIDDVRIYNRALSATEIKQLYNTASPKYGVSQTVGQTTNCDSGLSCGLVGYWTFDGKDTDWTTQKTNDLSGSGNHGTLTNMSTTTSPTYGKIGQGLKFDGENDYINVESGLNITEYPFTLSAWANADTFSSSQSILQLVDKSESGVYWTIGTISSGHFSMTARNTSPVTTPGIITPTAGVWYHVVGVFRSETDRELYVNGVSDATSAASVNFAATVDRVAIGYFGDLTPGNFLGGKIDDVRIYNRALSATEIKQLYNTASPKYGVSQTVGQTTNCDSGLSCGLVGYWTFDGKDTDWTTQKTNDLSGSGNHGTLTNMSTTTSPAYGKIGQGLVFDGGDDYVGTSYNGQLTNFTVCAWFKADDITPSLYQRIVDKSYSTGMWIGARSGVANNWGGGVLDSSAPFGRYITLSAGQWHHLCSKREGTTHTIVGDGGAVSTSGTVSSSALSNEVLRIGISSVLAAPFNGLIDDVRIYNRALSADEITQLYNLGR
ncbi:MAG: hypothetical protein A3G52_00710 [Candidatus Taylorbacteria bacterium RIFCSPLOWO2_12_FULL_43_20]|uniref:LamG-like jellyroll fold domain-containing protein n=1 Tax=Candidatus Taylorbacteria bacterium RIFCSPLOWO2_12_FULL_43_20 TaxID=1802332 RepID=A0A1G2P001_9BACT|nr:MAG: hypothetical protein A3G52_00710 [Candidatus Taylorbacteria bacterium RIFCSPLOWO2_12_FULL_43_20]